MAEQILEQLFDSPLKVRLLKLFLRHPGHKFTMKEITQRVNESSQACRRHIEKFRNIKLVESRLKGRSRFYSVNTRFDFYNELRTLVLKSSPASKKKMIDKFKKIGRVKLIVLSGIFVNLENPRLDILIVADNVKKSKLSSFLNDLEAEAGKDIDYVLLTSAEFKYRYGMFDRFLKDILERPHEKLINKLNV